MADAAHDESKSEGTGSAKNGLLRESRVPLWHPDHGSRMLHGMSRLRCALRFLIAVVLFVQSGAAAAHCLRVLHDPGFAIEICTAEGGVRIVHLEIDGPGAPADHAPGFCVACHALPQLVVPPPPALAERLSFAATPVIWSARSEPRVRIAPSSYAPRGPPIV
ncbi:hypothetical protein [Elioraea sp.]